MHDGAEANALADLEIEKGVFKAGHSGGYFCVCSCGVRFNAGSSYVVVQVIGRRWAAAAVCRCSWGWRGREPTSPPGGAALNSTWACLTWYDPSYNIKAEVRGACGMLLRLAAQHCSPERLLPSGITLAVLQLFEELRPVVAV